MRPTTQTPLPRVRDIIRSLLKLPGDAEIAAPWANLEDNYFWFSKSAHSLAVIAKCRQAVKKEISIKVWVPDFFCFESLKFLLDTGSEVVFYTVNEDLTPDINNCEILAQSHKVDIFLHAHFFGEVVPTNLSAKFAKDHGAWLVEDAAHVLRAVKGIGAFGDCILYSPHKHLPIPDGAILVLKKDGVTKLGVDTVAMDSFQEITFNYDNKSKGSASHSYVWLIKRVTQRLGIRKKNSNIKFYPADLLSSAPSLPKMSNLSKRLLSVLIRNLDSVSVRRKLNSSMWIETMSWSSAGILNSIRPLDHTPYLVGFSGSHNIDLQDIFESLSAVGVDLPVTSWPDLPPDVVNQKHRLANQLRSTRLYLPVHQSLSTKVIDKYGVKIIKVLTQEWTTKNLSESEWDSYWGTCPKANVLQSRQYGDAKTASQAWQPHRLLVLDHCKNPVAIVQILTKKLPFIGGIAKINRGPILLEKDSSERELGLMFGALNTVLREARRKRWWVLAIAPEIHNSENAKCGLKALGFREAKSEPWASGLIPLLPNEDTLLMSFTSKWRNHMRKGIKLGVKIKKQNISEVALDTLVRHYSALQNVKGFAGLPTEFLETLADRNGYLWEFNLFFAYAENQHDDEPIGVLVSIRSGDTSTYFIGTTNDIGRKMQANAVLLWDAMIDAKKSGCEWYDIGGLNQSTPHGIASFKKGLNAVPYKLVGQFYRLIWPWNFRK